MAMFTKMDAEAWFVGILQSVIGGAASAVSAWLGINVAGAAGAAVPVLNFKAMGIIMLTGALTNLFFYLKQSPIPKTVERTETSRTTVTKEITETPTEEDK
jgi:hypothetical protein